LTTGNILLTGTTTAAGAAETITSAGNIEGAGKVTAKTVSLSAVTGIGDSTALNLAAANIGAGTTNGSIVLNNTLATAVSVSSLSTGTGSITFNQAGGGSVTFTSVTTSLGTVALYDAGGNLLSNGGITAGGEIFLHATSGNINLVGNVNANGTSGGTITMIANAGSIEVSSVSSVGGTVQLSAAKGITQYPSTALTEAYLRLLSSGGNVTLTNSGNNAQVLAAALSGASSLNYYNANALTLDTVPQAGTLPGSTLGPTFNVTVAGPSTIRITTGGNLTSTANGNVVSSGTGANGGEIYLDAVLGNISLNGNVTANGSGTGNIGGNITIQAMAGTLQVANVSSLDGTGANSGTVQLLAAGNISQSPSSSAIRAQYLRVNSGGNVVLTNANNDVGVFSALLASTTLTNLSYNDLNDVVFGQVPAFISGIGAPSQTVNGVTTTNAPISLTAGGTVSGTITVGSLGRNANTLTLKVGRDINPTLTVNGNVILAQVGGSISGGLGVNGNVTLLTVGQAVSGTVQVNGQLTILAVTGDVSGSVTESGTITLLTIGGSLTPKGVITASNTNDPRAMIANITTMTTGLDLAGTVLVTGTLANLSVGRDLSGSVTEAGTIVQLTVGRTFTQTGVVKAVNSVSAPLGNINTLSVGQDFAGTLIVSGTLGSLAIVNGSLAPTASITVGNLTTLTIGPNHLSVGQNMAGTITVYGTFQSLRVAGGTPGSITAGHIGTIAVYGGFGPVVLQVTENGVQRRVEAAIPSQPYPLPNPSAVAMGPGQSAYINFQYFYESASLANPQLTVRITNGVSTAPDQFDLSLVVYSHTAKFNLARLDASGVSGVRNVDVEGDLLTSVSAQAASSFAQDTNPAGIRLPNDHLAGVGIRDYAPNGYIQVRSIQAVAFGSCTAPNGTIETGAAANSSAPLALLAPGTAIVQANDTFRVPFTDQSSQQVALFLVTSPTNLGFDSHSVVFQVEGILSPNSAGTANVTTPSNTARGAVTALVTAAPPSKGAASVIQTVAFRGDGASIQTSQWISSSITSTGPLGDLNLLSSQGITNVTAPSIFGSIISGGQIIGTIQTTGIRTDPITGATSSVPANFGNVYVAFSNKGVPSLTCTVVQAQGGGISGRIISRGNLISLVSASGGISGVIAVQGNLGVIWTISKTTTRLGGLVSGNGTVASGSIVVLGQQLGDVSLNGTLSGSYAVKGGIVGNLSVGGGLGTTGKVISGGEIGDPGQNTHFTFTGTNSGIIAAEGKISFYKGAPGGYVFNNVGTSGNPNAAAINAIFTYNGIPLALDLSGLDLGGLASILLDLQNLKVVNGTLTGPVP
jgi:hypothetical protein